MSTQYDLMKQQFEAERLKFQRETRRNSEKHELIRKFVDVVIPAEAFLAHEKELLR